MGTAGHRRQNHSWDRLPSLQPGGAGSTGSPVRDLLEGSTPKSRETDLLATKSGRPLLEDPEPGEIHRVPTSSPANFANFSPGALAKPKLGGHRRPPPPQPLSGRGPGADGQPPSTAAAAQPTLEPPPPARAAPPPARSPRHLPAQPAAQRSLPCWGRGLGRGKRPVTMGTAAGGACAEGPGAERGRRDQSLGLVPGSGGGQAGQRSRVCPDTSPRRAPGSGPVALDSECCSRSPSTFRGSFSGSGRGSPRKGHRPAAESAPARA